jgi:uncharacterized heparinase superfamily protein
MIGGDPGGHLLRESGYFRRDGPNFVFFMDVGEVGPTYLPGHAHCDMLSLELWAHGRPILVDTGTSTYEPGELRMWERSTAAHNTVQVGDREQSEIWRSFRVARRARPKFVSADADRLVAEVLAFPPLKVAHRRSVRFTDSTIRLVDQLSGVPAELPLIARFHFHPSEAPGLDGDTVTSGEVTLRFQGADSIELREYQYAPEFNVRLSGRVLEVVFKDRLFTEIVL